MKTIRSGSSLSLYLLAPGVKGYAIRKGNSVYIPFLEAVNPGAGDVGRFLDALPGEFKRAKIPNVMDPRLRAMLWRRHYRLTFEHSRMGRVDVWVKP